MNEDEIIQFVAGLTGVVTVTAREEDGAPKTAWGDSFFFYDPEGTTPADRRLPFATIVTQDYHGFDTASNLDRPGIFRLNITVGRTRFQELLGYTPDMHVNEHAHIDYTVDDQVLPHPVYAAQAWISILNPGEKTSTLARALLVDAHARAVERHQARR